MVKMTKKHFLFLGAFVTAAVFIAMLSGCPNGSEGGAETVTLAGALKGLKLDVKLEGYDLKIAALDGDGKLLGEAELEKDKGGNLSVAKSAGIIPVSRSIEYGSSVDYSYVLEDLPSSTRIDFVLRAREEQVDPNTPSKQTNFDLADFDNAFRDFSTGSGATQSAPDPAGLELPAMEIVLEKVAISHASWNGKTPPEVPGVVQLLITDSNGFELGSAVGASAFMFRDGKNDDDYNQPPFQGLLPGKPAQLDILVEIPFDGGWGEGVLVVKPESITIGGTPGTLTVTNDDVMAGEKTVSEKILITLPADTVKP